MGSAGFGVAALALEPPNAQGEQLLLAALAMASSVSGVSNPPGSLGGRVELTALGVTTPGTITVNGTAPSGASINEVTPTIPAAAPGAQSPEISAFKHLTQKIFATVTSLACSSGLLTGGGLVRAESIVAEKYLFPADDFKLNDAYTTESANEFRNLPVRHTNIQQLLLEASWEYTQRLYPESSMAIAYMLFGPPVNVLPLGPVAPFLVKTATSSSPITIAQTIPAGSQMQFVVTGAGAGGTIVVSGTRWDGLAIGETITTTGNGTYTTVENYWTLNPVVVTGMAGWSITSYIVGTQLLLGTTTVTSAAGSGGQAVSLNSSQPTPPGMLITFEVNGVSGSGTITIVGTNQYNQPINEAVQITGNGIFYSANVYKAVATSGLTFTGAGLVGGTIGAGGVFGWKYVFNDVAGFDTFYTAMLALFDGTSTRVAPMSFAEEATWSIEKDKVYSIAAKGKAQSATIVGDRTTTPLAANRLSTLASPPDQPVAGWQTAAWLDADGTTPQTVALPTLLMCKLAAKHPKQVIVPLLNSQKFNEVHDLKEGREYTIEGTLNFKDNVQRENWRRNAKQILSVGAFGPSIGFSGSALYQKTWFWTMPFKFDGDGTLVDSTPAKANTELTIKGMAELSQALGYSLQLTIQNQQQPTYAA